MQTNNTLALDVGAARVGVARAHGQVRIAQPFTTLLRDETFWDALGVVISDEQIGQIVVGLPRNLSGQDTEQTAQIYEFVTELKKHTDIPIALQDEALTSKKAEEELRARGKKFEKGDIDALAATYILEDYLADESVVAHE